MTCLGDPTKVLVTGGAGFIGSHVVEGLVHDDYGVKVVDNLSAGSLANIHSCMRDGRVSFIKGDIRDIEVVRKCLKDVDLVVHLAAMVSVPLSFEQPFLTHEINVKGTLNLLKSCSKANVKKFIFVSSCSVYGEPTCLPVKEEHPTSPLSPYAESKLIAERHCKAFEETYGLKTVILRLFNVYGPRQTLNDYSGVITRFVEKIKCKLPLTIYGDGSQTRDFVHVQDVVDAILRALKNSNAEGKAFNVGFGKPTSVNSLAKTVLELTDAKLDVVYEEARHGEVKHIYADISQAKEWLGYKPEISLEDGLRSLLGDLVAIDASQSS